MNKHGKRVNTPAGTLSTGQAARVVGVTAPTLWRWVDRGWLEPLRSGAGKGSVFGWRVNDLVAGRTLVALSERVSEYAIKQIAQRLKAYSQDLSSAVIVLSPDKSALAAYQVIDRERWTDAVTCQHVIKVVTLAPIMAEVAKARAA